MEEEVKGTADAVTEAAGENTEALVKEQEKLEQENPEKPLETETPGTEVSGQDQKSLYSPFYVPDQSQKKNNRITIVFVVILLICLMGGMIFAVSKLVKAAMGEANAGLLAWQETFDNWKESSEGFFNSMKPEEESDSFSEREEEKYNEDNDGYGDGTGEYIPSPNDDYYVELADSIREDLSYTVSKEEYTYYDAKTSVNLFVEYIAVDGLDFTDKINETLEEGAMYYAKQFGAENVSDLTVIVLSYVTYMDEDILSVVVDERYVWGNTVQMDLYCMNFDLKTGSLLYNTNIIEPDKELAEAFRNQSDYQNGHIQYVDSLTNKEIADYLADENLLILYYTPVGMEIGFNYADGWISATLKEYEQYLSKL